MDKTIIHLFFECIHVEQIWNQLTFFGTSINLQSLLPKTAIFWLLNMTKNSKLFNHLLLVFKINACENSNRGILDLNVLINETRERSKLLKKRLAVNDIKKLDSWLSRLYLYPLKLVSAIFYQNFIFHQMIALQKLWKMFFISSKKLFSFLRYSSFLYIRLPLFFPVSHCFIGWFKKNFKVYGVINCLNKNWITHYVWYLEKKIRYDIDTLSTDKVLNTEHFYGKIMQKLCTKS